MNNQMTKLIVTALLVAAMAFPMTASAASGEYEVSDLNEQLVMSVLWYQTSAEMRAISYQTFNFAKMLYEKDLGTGDSGKKRSCCKSTGERS